MITLIHGDDITKSRRFFIDQKGKYPDITILNGQEINMTDLVQLLEGGGLFTEEKLIFLENLSAKKKSAAEYKTIVNYLNTVSASANIYLWEDKILEKSAVTQYKNATIKLFKLPQSLFSFLDSLRPGNGIFLLKLYHEVLETTDAEATFYMLIRHIRIMLTLHTGSQKGKGESVKGKDISTYFTLEYQIGEVKRLQPWQLAKLQKQSEHFSLGQLVALHQKLYEIESGYKTGNLSMTLSQSIDILLLGFKIILSTPSLFHPL